MKYRLATILEKENHSSDTTKVIDIDVQDPISQMSVIWEPLNGSQIYGDGHPVRGLSKIELIDGSNVLFSLSGAEAAAAGYYTKKKEPGGSTCYLNGRTSEAVVDLCFGRYLYDPELALDPKKFSNLQLKVTLDINGGGSLVTSGDLTVLAHLFDGKEIQPSGFLMHKEIKSYTLANTSHEYTELPTDYPYRKLFIRAQRYGQGPDIQINTVKLSEDVDKKVPVNQTMYQLLFTLMTQNNPYREAIIGPGAATAQYFYNTPCYNPIFTASGWRNTIGGGDHNIYDGSGGRFQYVQTAAGPNFAALCEGYAPHGVIEIPFGLQDIIEDWYDVREIGNLKLDILGAASVGTSQTCEIFLQQLRNY